MAEMTKPNRLSPAMLKAARAIMQPGDRARFMLPNGVAFELVAGNGTPEQMRLPANQSEPETGHLDDVARLTAALTSRRRQRA